MRLKHVIPLYIIGFLLTIQTGCVSIPRGAMVIVRSGRAKVKIVIPDKPTKQEIRAAKELSYHLQLVTGSKFKIIFNRNAKKKQGYIFVGETNAAKQLKLFPLQEEQWVIKLVGQNLVLAGGGVRGTLYAVYHFLENDVGVRWWTPWDKTIPELDNLFFTKLARTGQPSFSYRNTYATGKPPYMFKKFCARNRINGAFADIPAEYGGTVSYGISWDGAKGMTRFKPEMDASNSKKTRPPLNDLSDDTQRLIAHELVESIKLSNKNARQAGLPKPVFYHFSATHFMQAPFEHKQMKQPFLEMLNKLSNPLLSSEPGIKLETWAYGNMINPPGVKLNSNIALFLCDNPGNGYFPELAKAVTTENHYLFRNALEKWSQYCDNLYAVTYAAPLGHGVGLPYPVTDSIQKDYQFFKTHGVKGVFTQAGDVIESPFFAMTLWIQAKMMENPKLDYNKVVSQFLEGYYLNAAPYIKEFLRLLDEGAGKWPVTVQSLPEAFGYLTPAFLLNIDSLLEDAEDAIDGDRNMRSRVRQVRASVDYAILMKWQELRQHQKKLEKTVDDLPFSRKEIVKRYSLTLIAGFRRWYKGDDLKKRMIWLQNHLKQLAKFDGQEK